MTDKTDPSNEVVKEAVERLKRILENPEMTEALMKQLPPKARKEIAFVDEDVIKVKKTLHGYRLTLESSPMRPYVQTIGNTWACDCGFKRCTHISTVLSHIYSDNDNSISF